MSNSVPSLLLFLSLSGIPGSSDVRVIAAATVGECALTVEANESQRTLRLRAHHPRYRSCEIDRGSVVAVLAEAFSGEAPPKSEAGYSSLYFGRLIDFPWLSRALAASAARDPAWDPKRGKPASVDVNKYVARTISGMELVAELDATLAMGGYRVAGVSVEKVLVGSFRDVPSYRGEELGEELHGRVPFDAQVWFRLAVK
jgi:hypothetical protein